MRRHAIILFVSLILLAASCARTEPIEGVILRCDEYTLTADSVVAADGIAARAISSFEIISEYPAFVAPDSNVISGSQGIAAASQRRWVVDASPADFPEFAFGQKLPEALYYMSATRIASDSISELSPCAIALALAYLSPERSMQAVKARIVDGVFCDPSLGFWPVDAGAAAWILAGWEVFKVNGDEAWGRELFDASAATLNRMYRSGYDPATGLIGGGAVPPADYAGFYPSWMGQADIARSMSLTSNVIFCQAYKVLAMLGEALGEDVSSYRDICRRLNADINLQLWMPHAGCYSQYLYGGAFPMQAPFTDNLGQALAIISGVAIPEMAERIFSKTAVSVYGVPALWPCPAEAEGMYYGVCRADVQACWIIAAARSRSFEPMLTSIAAMMRAQAMMADTEPFINMSSGKPVDAATQGASDALRLNAAASYIAPYFKAIAGFEFTASGIAINPVVPPQFSGEKRIERFRYRKAELSVVIRGTGSRVARFAIDGVSQTDRFVPGDLVGHHAVEITMANNDFDESAAALVSRLVTVPGVPIVTFNPDGSGRVNRFSSKLKYQVWVDGIYQQQMDSAEFAPHDPSRFGALAISASNDSGQGYATRPMLYIPPGGDLILRASDAADHGSNFSGDGHKDDRLVESSAQANSSLEFSVVAERQRECLLDMLYANGGGPELESQDCAMREVIVNGLPTGALILPSLGPGDWERREYSSMLRIRLEQGENLIEIVARPSMGEPAKMPVLVDCIRIVLID